ncbi:MAG: hypothetical protein QG577_681 [Thermodesulfobacteriota bacterium]|nr:hypothetical protein [Thermodesulfobacteriota bacterium]
MTYEPDYKPQLRMVEPFPAVVQGKRVVGLKDPLGLSENVVLVPQEVLPLLALFDGRHSLRDIQADLSARAGRIVFLDEIIDVVRTLDKAFLFEGLTAREAFLHRTKTYRNQSVRPCSHAGSSYDPDPEKLSAELQWYFSEQGRGPGQPDFFSKPERPVGLIAPHIDIRAGGACFSRAYHALAQGQPSDVYVILGTGHAGVQGMFTAGTLDYQTPLGVTQVDRDVVDLISKEMGRDAAEEEILHATEHVIEFQVLFLQHMFSGRHEFKIVPILCSLSHRVFDSDARFAEKREMFACYCRALRKACLESGKSVCFIASADLDHVGPRYGDEFVPHRGTVEHSLAKDMELLQSLANLKTDDFIRGIQADDDSRRVCGFSPIVTMMHSMDAAEAELLNLDFAYVDDQKSFVSFGAMIFY